MPNLPANIMWQAPAGGYTTAGSVVLYNHTWTHITNRHPEILPLFNEVRQTIVSPTAVYRSATDPANSVLFFNNAVTNSDGEVLAVPVRLSIGIVTTACFRNENYSGGVLWMP